MSAMRRFNPGDKVVYISHDCDNHFYPKYGTIGTIVETAADTYIVQWPLGSVSAPYKWHALDSDLELATKETEEKDMFKVGDIVRGTKKADDKYCITTSAMIKGRVTKCFEATNMIEVQILNHKTSPSEIGETYTVRPEYFELVSAERAPTEPPKTGFKVGDIVRGKEGNRYEFDVDNSNKEFELVEAEASPSTADSFEMVFKPPFTYAVLRDAAGHVVAQGEAKCSSEDTFSKPEGAALATQRLLEKLGKPSASEKPFFSRDNLKTGDWVYTAEDVYQVFESPAFGKVLVSKSGWLAVADFAQNLFDDDPTGDNEFNVCKVVRPTKGYHLCYDHRADGECIFERE